MTIAPLWIAITLGLWLFFGWLHRTSHHKSWLNPTPWTIGSLVLLLLLSETPYETFANETAPLSFLLGPATVALALPLYRQWRMIASHAGTIVIVLVIGAGIALASGWWLCDLFQLSQLSHMASLTRSISSPIALATAKDIGGDPSLAVAFVVFTGILGATVGPSLLDLLRVRLPEARGFAIGLVAHGLGTARAFQSCSTKGAWSSLAMTLNGILTPFVLPPLLHWLEMLRS